jgi:prolyl-tRNA synthetase
MLEVYRVFAEDYMRLPVICGRKTDGERFPGAVDTYAIEAMMQDGKALQAGTSHFLGQNFSRACSIKFADGDGTEKFVHTTSFGVSTRLIGGLIMALGDDDGLVLAPDIAPVQVAILPMVHGDGDGPLLDYAESLGRALSAVPVEHGETLRVEIDRRQLRGGEKFWQKIRCGIPILVEIGARELAAKTVTFAERGSAKKTVAAEEFTSTIADILKGYGDQLFQRQLKFRKSKTVRVKSLGELKEFFADGTGFAEAHFCGDTTVEKRICSELPISTRCVPFDKKDDIGPCIGDTGRNGPITIWAKAY